MSSSLVGQPVSSDSGRKRKHSSPPAPLRMKKKPERSTPSTSTNAAPTDGDSLSSKNASSDSGNADKSSSSNNVLESSTSTNNYIPLTSASLNRYV